MKYHAAPSALTFALLITVLTACGKKEQQSSSEPQKHVGLMLLASHPVINDLRDGFKERLNETASTHSVSIVYDEKNAEGNAATLNQLAAYFASGKHDLVYAIGSDSALKLKSKDSKIPVLFAGTPDPVRNGFVDSLEEPGSNLTGARFLPPASIILELITKAMPGTRKLAILRNPSELNSQSVAEPFIATASKDGFQVGDFGITETSQLPAVLSKIRSESWPVVFIPTDNLVYQNLKQVAASLSEAGIPFVSVTDSAVKAGAMFSIGVSYRDVGRYTADVASTILFDGKHPEDTPVLDIRQGYLFVTSKNAEKFRPLAPKNFPILVVD